MKINTFTVILLFILVGSIFQFDNLIQKVENMVTRTEASTNQKNLPRYTPTKIIIPQVEINLPVVSVPLQNGTWYVYNNVANFAEGTSLVNGHEGNVGIYAHDRRNGFLRIKELQAGDTIFIEGIGFNAVYKVESSEIIYPAQVNVFYPTTTPTLTLITCDGFFSEKRYKVRAILTGYHQI
jgi:LPXTG-site transpeptidase (sortase) family protein